MSKLTGFLFENALFIGSEVKAFLEIMKKNNIDENFLDEELDQVLVVFSELTEINMNMDNKLSEEDSKDFLNSLNDPEFQEALTTKIIALKSEIKSGHKVSSESEYSSLSKEQIGSNPIHAIDTNTIRRASSKGSNYATSNINDTNNLLQSQLPEQPKSNSKITDSKNSKNNESSNNETSPKISSPELALNIEAKNDSNESNQYREKTNSSKDGRTNPTGKNLNKYYYQIHQENLYSIYDCGLICPTLYDSKRTQSDIQDKYSSYLLMSKSDVLHNDGAKQILLELNLTINEIPTQVNNDGLFLFEKPLPVSRISKIIYSDKTYWERLMGLVASDAICFIPEVIASYIPNINSKTVKLDSNTSDEKLDLKEKLKIFDKRLGALSFMKNTNLYYGDFSNYSDNYFNALYELDPDMHFNTKIEKQTALEKAMNTESADTDNDIYGDIHINKEYLEVKLKGNKKSLEKLPKGPFSINKKDYLKAIEENYKDWFNVAYLAIYGDKSVSSNASIQLKNEFANEVKVREKADLLLSLLGAYYGYKAIRPHDQIPISSQDLLSKEIDTNTNIKFKMDSQLDYLTIETVYQKTFNNKVADKNFIFSFAPKYSSNARYISLFNKFNRDKYYRCTKQSVCDVEYVRIIKKDKKSVVSQALKENYEPKILAKKSLFSWVYTFFFEKGIVRNSPNGIYVQKEELIAEIEKVEEKNFEKLNLEWFDELIDLDIKYK